MQFKSTRKLRWPQVHPQNRLHSPATNALDLTDSVIVTTSRRCLLKSERHSFNRIKSECPRRCSSCWEKNHLLLHVYSRVTDSNVCDSTSTSQSKNAQWSQSSIDTQGRFVCSPQQWQRMATFYANSSRSKSTRKMKKTAFIMSTYVMVGDATDLTLCDLNFFRENLDLCSTEINLKLMYDYWLWILGRFFRVKSVLSHKITIILKIRYLHKSQFELRVKVIFFPSTQNTLKGSDFKVKLKSL